MNARTVYALAMERLYLACIVVSATALVLITLAIPYGVFMRYVMQSAASWPEPFSVLAMVLFSFVGGAAAYVAGARLGALVLVQPLPALAAVAAVWAIATPLLLAIAQRLERA